MEGARVSLPSAHHRGEYIRHRPAGERRRQCHTPLRSSASYFSMGGVLAPHRCVAHTFVGRLAHDPTEKREGVAASDFLDVPVGIAPLDQTPDDVLAIRR